MKTDTRWVIVGSAGLYQGQWLTRRDAIAGHVVHFYHNFPRIPNKKERDRLWKRCLSQGDRATKAQITWDDKP